MDGDALRDSIWRFLRTARLALVAALMHSTAAVCICNLLGQKQRRIWQLAVQIVQRPPAPTQYLAAELRSAICQMLCCC
jgi:hypothetical protein